ncbi:hypothetical protein U91I_02102 [alpha proteobacterium U9-1i]|nr:hypothetical protein U91I_02102 [alpha proteobacterium U9-1i]
MQKLNVDQLDKELRLAERGTRDGRAEKPATDAQHPSETEIALVERIEGALAQRSRELLGVASAEEFRSLPEELEALATEPQTVLTQFRGKKARAQSSAQIELANAQADFERSYHGYRNFRRQHGITDGEPRYDDVFWRKVFWLALLFVVEVVANGWVIGQASSGGLVQGWTTALLIGLLVVLTGSLLGAGPFRYMNYRGEDGRGHLHRLWAIPAMVFGVIALIFFAFYVAHYRAAVANAPLDAPVPDNILSSIGSAPFAPFEQLESLALFVIALMIGIMSIGRAAYWDDPYPGYGPRHRRMMQARDRTQELAVQLAEDIDEAKDVADQALSDVSTNSQRAITKIRQALSKAQDNAAVWDVEAAAILETGRDALDVYREANGQARGTAEPRHFAIDPFEHIEVESGASMVAALEAALSRSTAGITQCKSQLAGVRAQLESEYHSFYDDELSPFLRGVADSAAAKVKDEFADVPLEDRRARREQDIDPEVVRLKRGAA